MQKEYWLGFSLIKGLGLVSIKKLADYFDSLQEAWEAGYRKLKYVKGLNIKPGLLIKKRKKINISEVQEKLAAENINYLCYGEQDYPDKLKNIKNPPPVIYKKGVCDFSRPAVALVGSRRCTAYGREVAEKLSYKLDQHNITVVSGMARGIDSCSHRGALKGEGNTAAVLGSGLDVVYPPENEKLYSEIADRGAVISEFPLGTKPRSENFPSRNRIISGLAEGTVVIEAAEQSGSLITAELAHSQGRTVFAVPGNINRPTSRGCNTLLTEYALPVTRLEDILDNIFQEKKIDSRSETKKDKQKKYIQLNKQEEKVLHTLQDKGELHVSEIAESCSIKIEKLNSLLLELEIKGLVSSRPGKKYCFEGLQNLLKPI